MEYLLAGFGGFFDAMTRYLIYLSEHSIGVHPFPSRSFTFYREWTNNLFQAIFLALYIAISFSSPLAIASPTPNGEIEVAFEALETSPSRDTRSSDIAILGETGLAILADSEDITVLDITGEPPKKITNSDESEEFPRETCCDCQTVKSMLDPRPFLPCPMTWQKAKYLSIVGGIVGSCIALYMAADLDPLYPLKYFLTLPYTAVMVTLLAAEPVFLIVAILTTTYPEPHKPAGLDNPETYVPRIPSQGAENLGIIVACYKSSGEIEATVHALLRHVTPEQIFIIDNGNTEGPTDDTREKVKAISPNINYRWSPIGSKLIAQYVGSRAAKNFKYILTIDDDVQLPENFRFAIDLIDDYTKGVAYPLRGVHTTEGETNLMVEWQDIEYKLSDLIKLLESTYTTVLYPHGAISLWERETFEKILREHDAVFFYDDVQIGTIAKGMHKRIALASDTYVKTVVPTTLFGTPPNLYSQRVRTWDLGRHAFTARFTHALFCHWDKSEWQTRPMGLKDGCFKVLRTIRANSVVKATHVYTVFSNLADFVRIPGLLYSLSSPALRTIVPAYVAGMVIPVAAWNYIKLHNRPDLRSGARGILSFGVYRIINMGLCCVGAYRTWTLYFFNKQHVTTVREFEESNDPRAIWDYPRSNPQESLNGQQPEYQEAYDDDDLDQSFCIIETPRTPKSGTSVTF